MLKSVIICTAIATFAITSSAKAQYPYPGGYLLNSRQQDPDWAYQHRNDYGALATTPRALIDGIGFVLQLGVAGECLFFVCVSFCFAR